MLKNKRLKLKISQEELANNLGITQSYLSKLENNTYSNVNVRFIKNLSKELNLDPVEIFLFFYNAVDSI